MEGERCKGAYHVSNKNDHFINTRTSMDRAVLVVLESACCFKREGEVPLVCCGL